MFSVNISVGRMLFSSMDSRLLHPFLFSTFADVITFKMDTQKENVNKRFTFIYDDVKGTVHVVDKVTGEEYDLLKEDTGWFDGEFKFDI